MHVHNPMQVNKQESVFHRTYKSITWDISITGKYYSASVVISIITNIIAYCVIILVTLLRCTL